MIFQSQFKKTGQACVKNKKWKNKKAEHQSGVLQQCADQAVGFFVQMPLPEDPV